jgi:hypothetical protein
MSGFEGMTPRRLSMAACALALLCGLAALEYAHFRHHYVEAAAHTDGDEDHRHDERMCAVFHSGLLTESSFVVPIPESAAARLPAAPTRRRSAEPDVAAHAPRAPPRSC